MKAIRFYGFGGPVKLDEIPEPNVYDNDVLVLVKASQIGGDVLKGIGGDGGNIRGVSDFVFPHVPGYRGTGVVLNVGSRVSSFRRGDRVVINGFVNCRSCHVCYQGADNLCPNAYLLGLDSGRQGSMAEMVKAPSWAVFKLPDLISFGQATLFSNLALMVHAFDRARPQPGFTAAIFGCGLVGSWAIQVARVYGCSWMICVDKSDNALELARKLGANETVNADTSNPLEVIREKTSGQGVDVAIEVVGIDLTIQQTIESTVRGGTALLMGVLKPITLQFEKYYEDIIEKEIDIKSCFGKTQNDFERSIRLAESGLIDMSAQDLEEYELSSFDEAFKKASNPNHTKICVVRVNTDQS